MDLEPLPLAEEEEQGGESEAAGHTESFQRMAAFLWKQYRWLVGLIGGFGSPITDPVELQRCLGLRSSSR